MERIPCQSIRSKRKGEQLCYRSLDKALLTCYQADRSTAPLKDLQAETVKYVKARHFDTEATESNTTAYYTHDVVSGPLSGAEGKEEVHVHEGRDIIMAIGRNSRSVEAQLAKKVQPTESEEDVRFRPSLVLSRIY